MSRTVAFPGLTSASELFSTIRRWNHPVDVKEPRERQEPLTPGKTRTKVSRIGHYMKGRSAAGEHIALYVVANPYLVSWLRENLIDIDYDTLHFELIVYENGNALVTVSYGQIIGSRWLAILPAPEPARLIRIAEGGEGRGPTTGLGAVHGFAEGARACALPLAVTGVGVLAGNPIARTLGGIWSIACLAKNRSTLRAEPSTAGIGALPRGGKYSAGPRQSIAAAIRTGSRPQGTELTVADVGREFGEEFGKVGVHDIGKRVWLKSYGIVMENAEQRDARKGGFTSGLSFSGAAFGMGR